MPKELEEKLKRAYRKKGLSGERLNRAVYGTMNKIGVIHGNKITAKGREMEHRRSKPHNPPYPGVPGAPIVGTGASSPSPLSLQGPLTGPLAPGLALSSPTVVNPSITRGLYNIPGASPHEIIRTEAPNSYIISLRGDSTLERTSGQPQSAKNLNPVEFEQVHEDPDE